MLRQVIILNRAIAAARSFKTNDIAPIIIDGHVGRRKRGEYDKRLTVILSLSSLDHGSAENPLGMTDAAVETPAAAHAISAAFARAASGRKERNGGGRDVAAGEYMIEPRLRQESAKRPDTCGPDHAAPAAGEVVVGDLLEHQHLGNWICFQPPYRLGQFELKKTGASQCRDRLRSKRGYFFALPARCSQDFSNSLDSSEQVPALTVLLLRRLSQHFSSLKRFVLGLHGLLEV